MKMLLLSTLISFSSLAQHQERRLLIYNVAFGAFTSGVGAVINKPKNENWRTSFARGFWQGSIGGVLTYSGKKAIYLINKKESLIYGWPAKILHSAGVSITENAARNKPFLQNWHMDFGPLRFDVSVGKEKAYKARFLPYSIYSVVAGLSDAKFDLSTTLLTGSLSFCSNGPYIDGGYGLSYERGFSYVNNSDKYHIIAHELIHQLQFTEYQVFNAWLKPLENKFTSQQIKIVFSKYVYFDAPYFLLPYGIEGKHDFPKYYDNFFEFEAERFATNEDVN